ncbi:DUF2231 domain-containing protein [Burkholderia glumae]|uniref:DUF2231 domain-containing protein n=1 Tax=Burkholderia glumae TaxID=337 RepID=UPI000404D2F5|nr:DUF2231 domain-containing protein [Burkholderia glumae]QKM57467.1 hypothetical protein CG017_05541 [Burkholderia glumae]
MTPYRPRYRSRLATAIFDLLNPITYGLFVGTLIFDVLYANTANILWAKGAAWQVSIGLVIAIVPRLLNLGHVWLPSSRPAPRGERLDFWLNLAGIAAAIANAFVHSRDAYAIVPENVILSLITVVLLGLAQLRLALDKFAMQEVGHE